MYILLIAIFANYIVKDATCGIPVLMWVSVHLSLFMLQSLLKVFAICVIRYCYPSRVCYNISTSLSVNLIMTGWLIYGNVIYFSNKNNCGEIFETRGLNSLMLFFLVIGYF